MSVCPIAMHLSGVTKSFGRGRERRAVLNDVEITVPTGSVYCLLGPSGCGKTMLIRCIAGRIQVDDGHLEILRQGPGTVGCHVPEKAIGYMPQELALYKEFTIEETLNYFGRVNGMLSEQIQHRKTFLTGLLDLPERKRIIREISGGQQRRTSLAVALLHEPNILILDEPTVGVDHGLRKRIWNHLIDISQHNGTTVIISTHYIEEAEKAHRVCLMRDGCILDEESPYKLRQNYALSSLVEVYERRCEGRIGQARSGSGSLDTRNVGSFTAERSPILGIRGPFNEGSPLLSGDRNFLDSCDAVHIQRPTYSTLWPSVCWNLPTFRNISAVFVKNLISLKRQKGLLLFEFLLPMLVITLFCLCIGGNPHGLPMAIVNNETCPNSSESCASEAYLRNLNPYLIIQENFNHRFDDALGAALDGKSWGVINIGDNFTNCLIARYLGEQLDNWTIDGSTVHLYLDMTNQLISLSLAQEVLRAFQSFAEQVLKIVGLNPDLAQIPVKLEAAIYGNLNPRFIDFNAPGIIVTTPFFLATGLTALSFVTERKQGLLDRTLASGVGSVEIMIAHIATQFLAMLVQVAVMLIIALAAFKIPLEGSLILVIILTLLQGFTGMTFGFLVSTFCEEETSAIQFALGSIFPNLLLSGILWPLEAMPTWLLYISYCLPMTLAADAMRNIMLRGWGLRYLQVWRGFVMSIGWGGVFLILSCIALTLRRF